MPPDPCRAAGATVSLVALQPDLLVTQQGWTGTLWSDLGLMVIGCGSVGFLLLLPLVCLGQEYKERGLGAELPCFMVLWAKSPDQGC